MASPAVAEPRPPDRAPPPAHHTPHTTHHVPRWLHWWAVLTVLATCPLLLLGAEVTTNQWGLVDPRGFRMPWHLAEVSWVEKGLAYIVEHGHRLFGFVVGTCSIVLALGLLLREPRRWVKVLGVLVLAGVVTQGVLGILRVELHALVGRNIALVHGCFAQLVFGLMVSVAVVTSRSWLREQDMRGEGRPGLFRLAVAAAALVWLQGVLGAVVRHRDLSWGARAHLLMAFLVVAAVAWLIREVLSSPRRSRQETTVAVVLACVTLLQLALGVESWLTRFAGAGSEFNQLRPLGVHGQLVRSVHYFVGSLVFVSAVALAWQIHRRASRETSAGTVEGRA